MYSLDRDDLRGSAWLFSRSGPANGAFVDALTRVMEEADAENISCILIEHTRNWDSQVRCHEKSMCLRYVLRFLFCDWKIGREECGSLTAMSCFLHGHESCTQVRKIVVPHSSYLLSYLPPYALYISKFNTHTSDERFR